MLRHYMVTPVLTSCTHKYIATSEGTAPASFAGTLNYQQDTHTLMRGYYAMMSRYFISGVQTTCYTTC